MIEGTVAVWCDAVCEGRYWSPSLDAPRFRAGFVKLAQVSTRWPTPADFLAAMPAREQLALQRESRPATKEEAEKHWGEIGKLLRLPPSKRGTA